MNYLNGPLPDRARASHDLENLDHDFGRAYDIASSRDGTFLAALYRDAGDEPVITARSAAEMRGKLEADYAARSLRRIAPEHVIASHRRPK